MFNELTLALHVALLIAIYAFLFLTVRTIAKDLTGARRRTEPAKSRATARLVVSTDGAAARDYPIGDELLIGRAPDCDIMLDETFVSARHARVYRDDAGFWLEDLKSTNGTLLNGARVAGPVPLKRGAKFTIGASTLRFVG